MRLAIVNLTSGGLSGGYRKYLETLLPLLRADPRISDLTVFLPAAAAGLGERSGVAVRELPIARLRGRTRLRDMVHAERPDVVFIPTSRWTSFGTIPTVVMVRNMEPLDAPFGGNGLGESLRNIARMSATRRACERADAVIAASSYVSDWITGHWGVQRKKIHVVYHGVEQPDESLEARPPASLAGDSRFLFTAGSIRPARGLRDAIEALPAIVREQPQLKLAIAGEVDRSALGHAASLRKRARELGVSGSVLWLGRLSATEMRWCFRNCATFIVTSRAEACPNTVLEAMANGCLIVSGSNPPMPEFLRGSAAYYRPSDPASLAVQVTGLLDAAPAARADARALAARLASDFDWKKTADATVTLLADVAG